MCQSDRENFIVSRGSYFVDGTRCESESLTSYGTTAACLQGRCQVHIVNRAPVFTHLAVMVGDQYIVSGKGAMALNVTHPSPLDEDHIQYRLHLTFDLLPEIEEVVVPGPLKQEISVQCSAPCGYGIQSRAVSCMGPSEPEPLSPLFCMHMPKPITIRGCYMGSCRDVASDKTTSIRKANLTEKPLPSPTPVHKDAPQQHIGSIPPRSTEAMTIKQTTTAIPTPKYSEWTSFIMVY
ncbi:hypothetical protein GOODEAATRI_007595 [Goodea atripinnis]|uniref:ADAMTS/ADAMTS-like Spacer 1 domain-containing protein n=1 Tax=Goodea atripinnis TaxID=208336 RepID=A0ABV0MHV0_9TELE